MPFTIQVKQEVSGDMGALLISMRIRLDLADPQVHLSSAAHLFICSFCCNSDSFFFF